MKFLKMALISLLVFSGVNSYAQRKPAVVKPAAVKFKPPKLITSLGNYHDSASVSKTEAAALIVMPLKITDAKNNIYTISSYNFLYKKIVPAEDDKMSKITWTNSIKTDLFRSTPLPAIWSSTASENLLPGEEYFFFGVIAKDQQGRIMYAPDLKLVIK